MLRDAGADLVLLLAVLHDAAALRALVARHVRSGIEPFVEAHDARELDSALASDARLIGINNRDLNTSRSTFAGPRRCARWFPTIGWSLPSRA